jgi:rhodanese-related sulfurtransferase/predicted methyltransferase
MQKFRSVLWILTLICLLAFVLEPACAESGKGTRITHADQHQRTGSKSYPFRAKSEYVLREVDLRPGDVVVDIGAGDGWWTERMAKFVGDQGVIHAAEVDEKLVAKMKDKFSDVPQVKPYKCKTDSTGLPENSCDLAFFSQSYHHLDHNAHVDYLRHLCSVVKPTGRVVIIEKNSHIATRGKAHGTYLSELVKQSEEAGWVPVRCELMTGTYHFIVILAQRELFPPEPEEEKKEEDKGESAQSTAHTNDSLHTVKQMLSQGKAMLVDVRERGEWDEGHLKAARFVPLSRLLRKLTKQSESKEFAKQLAKSLPKDKVIYCHCRSGGRVLVASPILRRLGYDIRPLKAGYADLLKAGFDKAS